MPSREMIASWGPLRGASFPPSHANPDMPEEPYARIPMLDVLYNECPLPQMYKDRVAKSLPGIIPSSDICHRIASALRRQSLEATKIVLLVEESVDKIYYLLCERASESRLPVLNVFDANGHPHMAPDIKGKNHYFFRYYHHSSLLSELKDSRH